MENANPGSIPPQPVANRREIYSLFLTSFAAGPLASVVLFFLQLMVVKQAKYLAAENSGGDLWIEWREKFADGKLCNGTGLPNPKGSANAYVRPEGYSDACKWFPENSKVPGLNIEYTGTIVYGMAGILFMTGILLLVIGPFGDYSRYRRQLLSVCFMIWVPCFTVISFVGNPDYYWVALIFSLIGATAYFFGLKSPFAAYLPLLIEASHELSDIRAKHDAIQKIGHPGENATSIELSNIESGPQSGVQSNKVGGTETYGHSSNKIEGGMEGEELKDMVEIDLGDGAKKGENYSETKVLQHVRQGSALPLIGSQVSVGEGGSLIGLDTVRSDEIVNGQQNVKEEYQNAYEAVAGKTALRESASFIGGKDDDPRSTAGERAAVLFACVWGGLFGALGISNLKDRHGPPFPPGNRLLVGVLRSLRTLRLMNARLPRLLYLMVGRMLIWLGIQTLISMSTLFFEKEFAMEAEELAPFILLYLVVGIASAILASILIQKWAGKTLSMFKTYCIMAMVVPFYMKFGIRRRSEIVVLMIYSSFVVAPFPALVRAMMADMIPKGYTTTIMSFEGLLENSTTWIGPLVVGGLLDAVGDMRWALFSMVVFLLLGLPFVFLVDIKQAHEQRVAFEKWMETTDHQDEHEHDTSNVERS